MLVASISQMAKSRVCFSTHVGRTQFDPHLASDQVVGDITQQIVYLTGLQKGQWGVLYLDKSYTFADPSRPSLRGAAVLLFYHDSKTSANGISLTGTYFYLLLVCTTFNMDISFLTIFQDALRGHAGHCHDYRGSTSNIV